MSIVCRENVNYLIVVCGCLCMSFVDCFWFNGYATLAGCFISVVKRLTVTDVLNSAVDRQTVGLMLMLSMRFIAIH